MFRIFAIVLSLIVSSQAKAAPIMIFMGGFGSCAVAGETSEIKSSSMMDKTMDAVRQVSGDEVVEIRTCYAIGNNPIYVTSEALDLRNAPMTRDDLRELVASTATENTPIYIWGQSHGGWTAMDLVRKLPNLNYRVLNTVDPISVAECGPAVFIGGVLSGSAPGCRRAPKDLESDFALIAKRVTRWTNWFQLEFSLLHSDRIAAAHENVERSFNAGWWIPMGAHRLMETDAAMWERVAQQVAADLTEIAAH